MKAGAYSTSSLLDAVESDGLGVHRLERVRHGKLNIVGLKRGDGMISAVSRRSAEPKTRLSFKSIIIVF